MPCKEGFRLLRKSKSKLDKKECYRQVKQAKFYNIFCKKMPGKYARSGCAMHCAATNYYYCRLPAKNLPAGSKLNNNFFTPNRHFTPKIRLLLCIHSN
jgi:hypothetical protein